MSVAAVAVGVSGGLQCLTYRRVQRPNESRSTSAPDTDWPRRMLVFRVTPQLLCSVVFFTISQCTFLSLFFLHFFFFVSAVFRCWRFLPCVGVFSPRSPSCTVLCPSLLVLVQYMASCFPALHFFFFLLTLGLPSVSLFPAVRCTDTLQILDAHSLGGLFFLFNTTPGFFTKYLFVLSIEHFTAALFRHRPSLLLGYRV